MRGFAGRRRELAILQAEVEAIRASGEGRFVTVRGRRRVGKSWLVEEFIDRSRLPHVFFAASKHTPERELTLLAEKIASSSLPSRAVAQGGIVFQTWEAALVTAAAGATREQPSVIVIDEFPWLLESRSSGEVEGSVNTAWERSLSRQPVLLILVGSDLGMMSALTEYGRPLHQRPTRELVVMPLSPVEVAQLTGRHGVDALEAYLVTGGFPKIAGSWRAGTLREFLSEALADEGHPLVSTGRLILDAEFPPGAQARSILSVIGPDERTHKAIAEETRIEPKNLTPPLRTLMDRKRVVEARLPLSTAPSTDTRYGVTDPYLRFYLRFIEAQLAEIERRRGRMLLAGILAAWETFRGRSIEPLIREGIEHLLPDPRFGEASVVGGYWTKRNDPEIDLVGADRRRPPVKGIAFIGSIKWRARAPFDGSDVADLIRKAAQVPGVTPSTRLVGVSRAGFEPARVQLSAALEADELLAAFPAG